MSKQRMVIIAAVDSDEADAGYGVMTERSFENAVGPQDRQRFSLLYGNYSKCETFDTFEAAMQHITECDGKLVNVHGAIGF